MTCAFASPLEKCDGRPQWHHVISKNRLKREFPYGVWWNTVTQRWEPATRYDPVKRVAPQTRMLYEILADERNRMWLCDHHHQKVTNARLYVDIPESVWEFAREFGLVGMLENDLARQGAA